MSDFGVILPAAGSSSRFQGFQTRKPFVDLLGVPVWKRTVDAFLQRTDVRQVVLVLSQDDLSGFRERFAKDLQDIQTVGGGASRAESVRNGLQAIEPSIGLIAVHDAARPLVSQQVIDDVFAAARTTGAAIPGIPVTSTVKRVREDETVAETIDRSSLRLAQTPQCASRATLQAAFDRFANRLQDFTDEASLVEATGHPVQITRGAVENLKITTAEDYQHACHILRAHSDGR